MKEVKLSLEDVIENIIEEILNIEPAPNTPAYTKIDELNLNLLRKEQQCNRFCKMKVKEIEIKPDPSFILDKNGILRKVVKLKYTIEPTIVVPRKWTNIIILQFHNGKGHSGNQPDCQHDAKILLVDWNEERHSSAYKHCKLCIQFLPNKVYTQLMHLEIPQVPFTSAVDSFGQLPTTSKGNRFALTFICLLMSYLITLPLKTKTADKVSMAYIKEILPKTSCSKFIL